MKTSSFQQRTSPTKEPENWRLGKPNARLLCFGLALITLLVYLPVRHHGFLRYDDPTYITNNRVVQSGLTLHGMRWAFTTLTASNWHPLTWLSHMLDCQLFGADAGAQHLVSVLWHAVNGALLLLLYYRLTGALWVSAFAAALLVWHPMRVESVAWAAERKDVLSVFFFVLTLLAYVRYSRETGVKDTEQTPKTRAGVKEENGRSKQLRFYFATVVCFALGLMSKPMLVTTPFVLLLLDYWPLRRFQFSTSSVSRLVREKLPLFAMSAACSIGTYLAQREEAVVPLGSYPLKLRLVNTLLGYGGYLWKTIWPVNLAIIYPFPQYLPWAKLILSGLVLAVVSFACWRLRRTRPHLIVGWLWFLGTLVPVIGLVQVGSARMADRYSYIPQIGLFLALTLEAKYWGQRWHLSQRLAWMPAVAVLAACLVLTARQLSFWRDGVSLFSHAVAITEGNPMAQLNLALSLEVKGARDQALQHYEESLRLNPELHEAHNALGDLLNELGRTNDAMAHYTAELRLHEQPVTHENLGALLVKLGRIDEAMEHYRAAARLDPTDPRAHYLMAKALLRRGRSAEAVAQFREALRRDPENVQSLVYLARVLAADPDPHVRDGAQAIAFAEKANALTGGEQSFMLDTLAMAYAEAGRLSEAQQTLRQAVERGASDDSDALSTLQSRLKLYQDGKPYREDFSTPAREGNSR